MRRQRILIIDDDPSLIESLTAALAPPYRVCAATTGEAAQAMLRTEPTDLVILDIMLGAEDGLDLVPRLRDLTPARILVLTGYGTRENLRRAIRAKPDDFLDKPVHLEALRSRIAALLRGNGDDPDPLERIHARITHEFHLPLTTEHLAWSASMSPIHFRRVFVDRFGLTPRAFLEQCRMHHAAALLRETDEGIKAIAARTGFRDPNNFSTAFKRYYGLCPEAFRARHRSSRRMPPPGAAHDPKSKIF